LIGIDIEVAAEGGGISTGIAQRRAQREIIAEVGIGAEGQAMAVVIGAAGIGGVVDVAEAAEAVQPQAAFARQTLPHERITGVAAAGFGITTETGGLRGAGEKATAEAVQQQRLEP